jgi:hypothetical protein
MLMFFAKGYSVCQKNLTNNGFIFLAAKVGVLRDSHNLFLLKRENLNAFEHEKKSPSGGLLRCFSGIITVPE